MGPKQRMKSLKRIARLRRAESETGNPEVATVRSELEEELGDSVSRNLAASLLKVSHTALNRWIAAGDIPVVISERGRKEVPVPALLDLYEQVEKERSTGERRRHFLEPSISETRSRAERMRPGKGPEFEIESGEPHRRAALRSLAYHRALAPRLRRPMIDEAIRKIHRWSEDGRIDKRYATQWLDLLEQPVHEIRRAISADDPRGQELRQSSPLAGLLSEPERRKILETVGG